MFFLPVLPACQNLRKALAGKVLSIASDTHVLEAKGRAEKEAETRKLEEAKKEAEKARAEAERKEAEETKKQQQEAKRQEAAKKKEAEKALAALAEAAKRKADKDKQTEALRASLGFRNHFSFVKVISEGLRCRRVSCVCACVCVCGWVCGCVGVWLCGCVGVWVRLGSGPLFTCIMLQQLSHSHCWPHAKSRMRSACFTYLSRTDLQFGCLP